MEDLPAGESAPETPGTNFFLKRTASSVAADRDGDAVVVVHAASGK